MSNFLFQKGRKPWTRAIEKSCIERSGECFLKCRRGNLGCRSFAVGDVSECPSGLQCLLYSEAIVSTGQLSKDDHYSYYVPVSITALLYFSQQERITTMINIAVLLHQVRQTSRWSLYSQHSGLKLFYLYPGTTDML